MPKYRKGQQPDFRQLLRDPGSNPYNGHCFSKMLRRAGTVAALKKFIVSKVAENNNHKFVTGCGQYHRDTENRTVRRLCSEERPSTKVAIERDLVFLLQGGVYFRDGRYKPYLNKQLRRFSALFNDEQCRILIRLLNIIEEVPEEMLETADAIFRALVRRVKTDFRDCRILLNVIKLEHGPIEEQVFRQNLDLARTILKIVPYYSP